MGTPLQPGHPDYERPEELHRSLKSVSLRSHDHLLQFPWCTILRAEMASGRENETGSS